MKTDPDGSARPLILLGGPDDAWTERTAALMAERLPRFSVVATTDVVAALDRSGDRSIACLAITYPLPVPDRSPDPVTDQDQGVVPPAASAGRADPDPDTDPLVRLATARPDLPIVLLVDGSVDRIAAAVAEVGVADVRRRPSSPAAVDLLARRLRAVVADAGSPPPAGVSSTDRSSETDVSSGSSRPDPGGDGGAADASVDDAWSEVVDAVEPNAGGDCSPSEADPTAPSGAAARYRRLVESNLVGIYTLRDRRFAYVNPKLAAAFGTTPGAMVGDEVGSYVAAEDRDRVDAYLAGCESDEYDAIHYRFRGRRVDGETIALEAYGARVETDDGIEIVGTLVDVTDDVERERELRRLSKAVDSAASAVFVTDADGRIEYSNPAFESLTGYSPAAVVGRTPRILQSGKMDDDYYRRLYETIHGGDVWSEDIVDRRANGELYYAHQTIAPITDTDGRVDGFVAIQTDATDRRIRDQVIQVLHRVLRHNLRNELNVIDGHAATLGQSVDGPDAVASLAAIQRAVDRLESVAGDASVVPSLVDGEAERRDVDLVDLLEREIDLLERTYPEAVFDVELPASLPIRADDTLRLAVHEVLENAVLHAEDPEPRVAVRAAASDEWGVAELTVVDSGPGLDPLEWTPVDVGTETPLQHASGVGLWLVEWAVTRGGGEVAVDTDESGTSVTVRLPLGPGDRDAGTSTAGDGDGDGTGSDATTDDATGREAGDRPATDRTDAADESDAADQSDTTE